MMNHTFITGSLQHFVWPPPNYPPQHPPPMYVLYAHRQFIAAQIHQGALAAPSGSCKCLPQY